MSSYEWDDPRVDDYASERARHDAAEYLEHRDLVERTRLDRLAEHVTPDPRPEKRVLRKDAPRPAEDDRWREEVFARDQGCLFHRNPAECSGGIEFHHVIDQKTLRKLGLGSALWRREIVICLCGTSHSRHTRALERVPVTVLPTETIQFVASLGLSHLIERYYAPAPRLRTEEAA